MAETSFDVGQYRIKEVRLYNFLRQKSIDITGFLISIDISESINKPVISGRIFIADTYGLIDKFPIRGEEYITIEYEDFFENPCTITGQVFQISGYNPMPQGSGVGYYMDFVSPQQFLSDREEIKKSYTGTCTDIAKLIYDQYLNEVNQLPFDVEDSAGVETFVIPALRPLEAIDFLARRAFTSDRLMTNYRFFATRYRYVLATYEQLLEQGKRSSTNFFYKPDFIADISLRGDSMFNIHEITVPKTFHSIERMRGGVLSKNIVRVDLTKKEYLVTRYDYYDRVGQAEKFDSTSQVIHSPEFLEQYASSPTKSHLMFIDSTRDQKYKEIVEPKGSVDYVLDNLVIDFSIYGHNSLSVGDVVTLDIPKFENTVERTDHPSLSGNWLIHTINHQLTEDSTYYMRIRASKDRYIKGLEEV